MLLRMMIVLAMLSGSWSLAPKPASADTKLAEVTTGNGPYSTAVNPVTNHIYIANEQDNSITVIDGATNEKTIVAAWNHPTAIAVNPVTNKIYVTHRDDDKVSIIDGASHATEMIDVGDGPVDIAVNAVTNKIYVANIAGDDVTVIDGASHTIETVGAGDEPNRISVNALTNKIYVVNKASHNVTVIDGADNSTNTVTVESLPSAVAVNPITNKIYVANQGGGSVTVIDGADNSTERVTVGVSPTHIAANPVTNKIYVANQGDDSVTVINGADNSTEIVAAGNGPRFLTVNSVTNKIYVANFLGDDITVIDGASNTPQTIAAGDGPYGIAVNPVTNQVYVANQLSNTVTVIDGAVNQTETISAGNNPYAIAVNAVTNKIYITNFFSSTVTVINGADNTIETVAAGSSYNLAVNEVTNKIYVANYQDNTVTVIDGVDLSTEIVDVGNAPSAIAVNPITNKIYVANQISHSVSVIDGSTNEVETIATGTRPFAIAVNPIKNEIYVTNLVSNDVTIIDGADNTTETISVGADPHAIAVNSVTNKIYVANQYSDTVTVIDGEDHTTESVATGIFPGYLAVNAKTNKIYVSAEISDTVTVIDGADNSTITVAAGNGPRRVSINPATNKIYVFNAFSDNVTVIDGNSNTTETIAVGIVPGDIAVNTATNRIYVTNQYSESVSVIDGAGRTSNPLQVEILPLPGHVASGVNDAFTFRITNAYHPNPTKVLGLYYQLDDTRGEWKRADAFGEDWAATVSSATYGRHVLYALALEAQGDGVSAGIASAYAFNMLPENTINPAAASFDKYAGAAAHADITTTLTLHGYPVASIASGATPLVRGTDYSVTGNTVTIKKDFLAAQPIGTMNLTFTFGSGTTLSLPVTVMDSTPSAAKAITAFSFASLSANGTVNEADHTVSVKVPYGTDVTSLTPTIAHTGASISPDSGVAQNFTNPVTYTVTAADGSTHNYVVTVKIAPASAQQLTADRADRQVNLNWASVTGATYYNVYVSTVQGLFTEPAAVTVTDAKYNMAGLTNGTTYYFIVKAGNTEGLSAASNEAVATPGTFPDAPINVIAVAGEERATVSFIPPANDGGYAITSYEVAASSGGIVRSGASSPITVTGLTPGISYTFTVKAINDVGKSMASAASNAVIPSSPPGGNNNSSSNSNGNNTDNEESAVHLADVLLNHQVVEAGAKTTVDHGNKMLTIVVDRTKLENRLAAEEQGAIITYRANSSFDRVVAEMDFQLVKSMATKQAVITLKTDKAKYVLPVRQLNLEALASRFGDSVALQDIKLKLEINARGAQNTANSINDAVSKGMFTLLVPPIEFNIQAIYGETTVEVSKFNTFLEHWIAIPDNVNPDSVTAAVVVEPDGVFRSVPTQVIKIENRHYAKISSLTNGAFALVSRPNVEFSDVSNHWAGQAIRDMGKRMIVEGTGNLYEPDREVTRAEFAAILVRGLGLPLENEAAPFSDIPRAAWFNNVVHTAYTYRLLTGFGDGTFHPKDTITREQAMVMLSRAMTFTGLKARLPGHAADEALHLPFTDTASASRWALDGIADSIQAGVVKGKSGAKLAPQDFVTRAEAATIVQRLLQLSDLI
ncbi:S-layer homology domain-containing protein [Cohnella cholangitidis]|nr:S-layer homology domain-containing protein [Cohnella cholangitidis]